MVDTLTHGLATVCFAVAIFLGSSVAAGDRFNPVAVGGTVCLCGFGVAFARKR